MSSCVSTNRPCLRQRHQRHPHARLRAGRVSRPSASRTRPPPSAAGTCRAKAWCRRSTSWRSSTTAVTRHRVPQSRYRPAVLRRCAACQAASLAYLRARFDLTTHGKILAARLGSAVRKTGSHLRLPRRSSWCGARCTMTEQHLASYERDFNSEVQQLRDIAARFERAARHCFNSKVQRLRDIVERFEWVRLYSIRRRRTARIERITNFCGTLVNGKISRKLQNIAQKRAASCLMKSLGRPLTKSSWLIC